jgi:hypothetical protein
VATATAQTDKVDLLIFGLRIFQLNVDLFVHTSGDAKNETPRIFSSMRCGLRIEGNARAWHDTLSHRRHVIPIGTASAGLAMSIPSA